MGGVQIRTSTLPNYLSLGTSGLDEDKTLLSCKLGYIRSNLYVRRRVKTAISGQLSSPSVTEGSDVTISGTITPTIPGQVFILVEVSHGVWNEIARLRPNEKGEFSWTWTPIRPGLYNVALKWLGDDGYDGSFWQDTVDVKARSEPPAALLGPLILGSVATIANVAVIAVARRRRAKRSVSQSMTLDARSRLDRCRNALTKLENLKKLGVVSERTYKELRAEYEAEATELERKLRQRK